MKNQLKLISNQAEPAENNLQFRRINQDTLRLQFGEACIELNSGGTLTFKNSVSCLQLQDDTIKLKTPKNEVTLHGNGDIILQGEQLKQKSAQHIELDAKQNIYLNSR